DWSSDVCSSDLILLQNQGMAWWLRSLHCRPTARRSWVRFPHGPLLVRGAGPPGFLPLRTPTEKKCKKNRTHSCPSLTKTDVSLRPWALKSCPLLLGGSWRKGSLGWVKGRDYIHSDLRPVCECVSCVAS